MYANLGKLKKVTGSESTETEDKSQLLISTSGVCVNEKKNTM